MPIQNIISYDKNGGDEQFTPLYGVEILIPYIQHLKDKIIWLPFDTDKSAFYRVLKKHGFKVILSSIETGQDFLSYQPEKFDVILSNPPYKNKRIYIERAISFNKPFLFLLPINMLSDSVINRLFTGEELQLLIPDKRMKFYHKTLGLRQQPSFKSAYIGKGALLQQIILTDMGTKQPNGFEVYSNENF